MCTHLDKVGSTYYFRRPVPKDLVGRFTTATGKPRTEWKFSLWVKDKEQAKRLLRPHVTETDKLIDEMRATVSAPPAPPKSPAQLERERARWEWDREQEEAQAAHDEQAEMELDELTPIMDAIEVGTVPDASPTDLVRAGQLLAQHERQMAEIRLEEQANARMARYAPKAEPVEKITDAAPVTAGLQASLIALFERYAKSGAVNLKTVREYRSYVTNLVAFIGHDDATKVTRPELNRWAEALIAGGLSAKTVLDGRFVPVRVILGIAYDDGLIPANPASGLKVRAPKAVQLRDRDLTDDEAVTILKGTLQPQPDGLAAEHAVARRWVPWLCAYTGARVGEITQLRACDIQQEGGTWIIHITPEAGSVKTRKARKVPLHPHLIEQGFIAMAKAGDKTPLFYNAENGTATNRASKRRAADISTWVRSLGVTDVPQPNHGWRHRFKTQARILGISEEVHDAITGHAPPNEGRKYGSVPLPVLKEAIEKLPRYLT